MIKTTSSANAPPSSPVSSYRVVGRVLMSDDTPIGGARVAYRGAGETGSALTDSAGYFVMGLSNGTYALTAGGGGYVAESIVVTVNGSDLDATLHGAFHLSKLGDTYAVEGRVLAPAGAPVDGARVAYQGPGANGSVDTDAQGYFAFYPPNGTYVLTVTDAGYQAGSKDVTVNGSSVDSTLHGAFRLLRIAFRVVANIPLGPFTSGMVYDREKGELFVTDGNNVSVVNDSTNTVESTIPIGNGPGRTGL